MALCFAAQADAQLLQVTGGDFSIIADARAHTQTDTESDAGTNALSSFSRTAAAAVSFSDPELGLHTASAAASLSWSGGANSLVGQVGGIAETMSNGLDTFALGAASVSVYFTITADAWARLQSEGTFNSDVYVFQAGSWVPFETGLNSFVERLMPMGQYRWDAGAGGTATGTGFESAGIDFNAQVQAVPEPATLAALGFGAGALLRRRRLAARR